ncbi:MAG: hypothetical protein ACI8SE_001896, partial [Bacteroidia bacterium]
MKNLLTILLCFFSVLVSAQIQVTDSLIETFLKKEIQNINIKLYNAALNGQIKAYTNDSFTSVYGIAELEERFTYEQVIQVEDRFGDVLDTTIIVKQQPSDLEGLTLIYGQNVNLGQYSFLVKVRGIGPIITARVGVIELGYVSLFIAKMDEVNQVLNAYEHSILKALLAQNSLIGDFRLDVQRLYWINRPAVAYEYALRSVQNTDYRITTDRLEYVNKTPLLSEYNRHVTSVVMSRIASDQEPKYPVKEVLFKDVELSNPYTDPSWELRSDLITEVEDEYGDLKDTVIQIESNFFEKYDYVVWENVNDYIFDFTIEQYGYSDDNGHIF